MTVSEKDKAPKRVSDVKAVQVESKPVTVVKKLDLNVSSAQAPAPTKIKKEKVQVDGRAYGTGRRKNAIARVWVSLGKGVVTVNKKTVDQYFTRDAHVKSIMKPFIATGSSGQYDVMCTVRGGGSSGQAGAILHGIARALDKIVPDFHDALHKAGLLTRDSRVVERKKYGKRKARKSTQFSKR